ncbi:MAG: proline permease [Caloramator sp.]|nr:MAG: proline permease [Caloramator sp.]
MSAIRVVMVIYMLVVLAIGYYAMKQTKSSSDFFIAGKKLGLIALAMASFSAAISGWVFVGGPGLYFSIGQGSLWMTFPTAISFAMAWIILGKRMRLLTEVNDCMTTPDAVYARYKSKWVSGIAAVAILVGLVLYLANQITAFAFILSPIFKINFQWAVLVGMGIVLIYSVAGGMLAGVYTDVFQGTCMIIASIIIFTLCLVTGSGTQNMAANIVDALSKDAVGAKFVNPWGIMPAITTMSWFFCLSIGIVGQPHIVHKFYMVKDVRKMRWGVVLAAIGGMVAGLLWFGVGLTVKYLSVTGKLPKEAVELLKKSTDNTIVVFLNYYTPKVIAGVVYAGIASAIMSTADSFINIAAASAVRDLPFAFNKKLTSKQELFMGRIVVVVIAVITIVLALTLGPKGIALLGAFGWGTFAAALAPAIGIGFNWSRGTKQAAFASIVVGLVCNVGLEIAKVLGAGFYKTYIAPKGIYNGTLSLCLSIIVYILVSYMTKEEKLDRKVEAVLEA